MFRKIKLKMLNDIKNGRDAISGKTLFIIFFNLKRPV